ncbi:MAG: metallophosphoesterase, partial [Firmicutes bacterium]|nr:metallophosphoesterase [Candidatus Fiminaster equi]
FIMNKKILFAIPLITCLLASCSGKRHYEAESYQINVKWEDTTKDFRILQLCDIHLSQSDIYEKHFKLIGKTIKDANANLIVLNGDSFTYADKGVATKLFSFIDSYNIPWTFTYGNHDDQGYFPDTYLQEILDTNAKLFKNVKFINLPDDDVTGRSNFVINIYDRVHNGEKYVNEDLFQVYLMESHSYNFDTIEYDFIKQDQIDWYERMVKYESANEGHVVPSAMYFHIPLPEFFTAWNDAKDGKENAKVILGTTDEFGGGPLPSTDTHLFSKVEELGSTIAISCAHDHINDSVINYKVKGEKDVALCFGVHSTDRIYYDSAKLGGQVIVVDHSDPWHLTFENIYHSYSEVEGK